MNFDNWVQENYLDLSRNYNSRCLDDSFQHFCEHIYVGIINGVWLPGEYTKGIINK